MKKATSLESIILLSKRPRVKRLASFNEQRDPQAKPAVLQYFGKTAVNNKCICDKFAYPLPPGLQMKLISGSYRY